VVVPVALVDLAAEAEQPALRRALARILFFGGGALHLGFLAVRVFPAPVGQEPDPLAGRGRCLDRALLRKDMRRTEQQKNQRGPQRRCSTQGWTERSAPGSLAASVPPACAMSGRPPPLPPTCCATWLTSSPAGTLPVRSRVTPAMSRTLPSSTAASTTAAEPSLFFSRSTVSRSVATSAPSRRAASTFAPPTTTACAVRSAPVPLASLPFMACMSFSCWRLRSINCPTRSATVSRLALS